MDLDVRKLLTGAYEAERLPADFSPGRLAPDFGFNVLNPLGLLYRPVVDEDYLKNGGAKPSWPGDKPFAVCLTHDVDAVASRSWRQALRLRDRPSSGEAFGGPARKAAAVLKGLAGAAAGARAADPFHAFDRCLDVEEKFGARSTFFFWPGASRVSKRHYSDCLYELSDPIVFGGERCRVREMIREMDRRGWEIGLHPSWYSYDDPSELRRQKESVEEALGKDVVSLRQHLLHFDVRVTPRAQSEAGFKYDSTLGFNDNVGFRFGTCRPWRVFDLKVDRELPLLEIPLIVQDVALMRPNKGLRLDPGAAFGYVVQLAGEVEKVGGVLTLLWHPDALTVKEYGELYLRTLDFLKRKNAWFASVKGVGDWWTASAARRKEILGSLT
jgi:peptidoglycan/xylan/chitin deacetylase (PgdA/CDA1 family)